MEIKTETFTDPRDGKVYKTVKIGEQVWMAENLNFECEGSVSYDNDPSNAEKYGRLYDWETAMKVCPPGWHLPSKEEWVELVDFAGGEYVAGEKLKATSGWNEFCNNGNNGTDNYGFSALPGGYYCWDGNFHDVGDDGEWWSADEHEDFSDCAYPLTFILEIAELSGCSIKSNLYSVRCIQDKASSPQE